MYIKMNTNVTIGTIFIPLSLRPVCENPNKCVEIKYLKNMVYLFQGRTILVFSTYLAENIVIDDYYHQTFLPEQLTTLGYSRLITTTSNPRLVTSVYVLTEFNENINIKESSLENFPGVKITVKYKDILNITFLNVDINKQSLKPFWNYADTLNSKDNVIIMGRFAHEIELEGTTTDKTMAMNMILHDNTSQCYNALKFFDNFFRFKNIYLEGVNDEGPIFAPNTNLRQDRKSTCISAIYHKDIASKINFNCYENLAVTKDINFYWRNRIFYVSAADVDVYANFKLICDIYSSVDLGAYPTNDTIMVGNFSFSTTNNISPYISFEEAKNILVSVVKIKIMGLVFGKLFNSMKYRSITNNYSILPIGEYLLKKYNTPLLGDISGIVWDFPAKNRWKIFQIYYGFITFMDFTKKYARRLKDNIITDIPYFFRRSFTEQEKNIHKIIVDYVSLFGMIAGSMLTVSDKKIIKDYLDKNGAVIYNNTDLVSEISNKRKILTSDAAKALMYFFTSVMQE